MQPPSLALALGERLIDSRVREAVLGDLVEGFVARSAERGRAAAQRWFWRQVLIAIVRFPVRPTLHTRGDGTMRGFLEDLHFGVRTLRRAPVHALVCALTLGTGIGAATAIFSIADPVIIRPLPYGDPARTVVIWEARAQRSNLGFATYADLRDGAAGLASTAAVGNWAPVLNRDGSAEQLAGLRVSWTYFRLLGIRPALGADFEAADDAQGHQQVVLLSHALWRERFHGDSSVIGTTVDLSGTPMRIAGVMPRDYDDVLQPGAQVWRVLGYDPSLPFACRTCRHLRMIARIRPGVARSALDAQLDVVSARLLRDHPHEYPERGFQVVGLQDEATRAIRPALNALLAGVALLLVIAAINVSGLQLARALRRDEEFAVRTALGAGSGRLTRQLLAEGVVLAAASAVMGLVIARLGLAALLARLPASIPRLAAVRLDVRAFALAAAVTITAGMVIGLAPAWHARRKALAGSLRGGRRAGGAHRLRGALVVSEVAVAVILLSGAGLLARSLTAVLSVDPGFQVDDVATAAIQVSGPVYADTMAVFAWQDRLLESVRAIPGVLSAGFDNQLPLGGNRDAYGIQAEDKPLDNPEQAPDADRYTVSTDFLKTMGIRVVAGRAFTDADNAATGPGVAIVSASLARRIWGVESPLGKRIHMGGASRPWYTVIGVAADVHHRGLDDDATMQYYVPNHRWFFTDTGVDVVVRTAGDPGAILPALRRAVLAPDPGTVITRLATMKEVRAISTAQRSLALTLFAAFAAVALLLAAAGLFGALAGAVAERAREIGLRSALGATPRDVVGMVMKSGLRIAAAGVAIGLAVALAGGGVIRGMLYGVGRGDAFTLVTVSLLIGLAAAAASAIPAWRAARVDPVTALRSD